MEGCEMTSIDTTGLVVTEPRTLAVNSTDFFALAPKAMIAQASNIANALKEIIVKQKFSVKLGAGEHVKVEGWQTLGTLLGILPKEKKVIRHSDGAYEAEIELVNMKTGVIVGGASSYCGMDEPNWAKKPEYARRSMAITRATGKAYKQAFGWIVHLAGFNPTPAEEMDGITPFTPPVVAGKPQKKDSIFRMENDDDCLKLTSYLEGEQVPKELWGAISTALDGKDKREIIKITKEIMRAQNAQ
jgi:hypothetical protein